MKITRNIFITKLTLIIFLISCGAAIVNEFEKPLKNYCEYKSDKRGYISWVDDCKLTWDNFKRVVEDSSSYYKARTITEISVKHIETSNDSIIYVVSNFFKEKKSYKTNDPNLGKNLLKHEQLHFDISEIAARKIRKKYSSYISKDGSYFITNKFVNSAFNESILEIDMLDSLYDAETSHGANYLEQEKWDKKIAEMLNEYIEYKNPRVVIKRKLSQEYLDLGKEKDTKD